MKRIFTLLFFIFLLGSMSAQIVIDGMLDWAGIDPLDTGLPAESYGEVTDPEIYRILMSDIFMSHMIL